MRHSEIAVASPEAQQHLSDQAGRALADVDRMLTHGKFLIERQRQSGIRVRLCSSGRYSLYNASGHFMAHTPGPDNYTGIKASELKAAAIRMALSDEMLQACRKVDADVELTGAVTGTTVDLVRALLATMGAA